MSTTRPELFPRPSLGSRLLRGESYVNIYSVTCIIHLTYKIICTMHLKTLQHEIGVMVAYIINKSSLVGQHAVPMMAIVGCMASIIHEQQPCCIKSM